MALVLANRVQETATPNTTVSFTLTGAVSGFQTFAVIGNTNTTYYSATDSSGNWEVGEGTYSTTGPTLTRTTVYASSNSGSAVTFPGSVNVFVTYPSGKSVNLDGSGNVSALGTVTSGTWQGSTVGVAYGGTGQTSYTDGELLIGNSTGNTLTKTTLTAGTGVTITNGAGSITIASTASVCCATSTVAGKVFGITSACFMGGATTALGYQAGGTSLVNGSVAIGTYSGSVFQGNCAVAVGRYAGTCFQKANAVAVGNGAGAVNQDPYAIAVGSAAGTACQSPYSIAIGANSVANGFSNNAVVIGASATASSCKGCAIAIGFSTTATGPSQTHIGPIRFSCCTSGLDSMFYCGTSRELIRGTGVGGVCCATPTTAGIVYGRTEGCSFLCGNGRTVLGRVAGLINQGVNAVAIGASAGQANQGACAIAIGLSAGGFGQPASSIAIGSFTAPTGVCQTHIGPVRSTCSTTGLDGLFYCACTREVIRGTAGGGVCCATPTTAGIVYGVTSGSGCNKNVALGYSANTCGCRGVAIGYNAGVSNFGSIAVGRCASAFANGAIAIGEHCGTSTGVFSTNAIGIGSFSTVYCASGGIAIGSNASVTSGCSIAIGFGTTAIGCFQTHIGPIRNVCSTCGLQGLFYCSTSREVIQGTAGVCCAAPLVAGKVFGRTTNLCCGALTALGENTTVTGCYSVSVGYAATTSAGGGVAVGGGSFASNSNGVALGFLTTAGACAVAIGASTSSTGPSQTHIGPIRNALGLYYLYYCPCTREITYS